MNQPRIELTWPPNVHVLIPAYRSADSLSVLLPRLLAFVPVDRICVVDDGSRDPTPSVCHRFGVDCLAHGRNRGKGAALADGFSYLTGNGATWIITLDADGQHAPEDLPLFLDAIALYPESGIIIGARNRDPRVMPWDRIISNTLTSFILSIITGQRIRDSQCGYRAYQSRFLDGISIESRRFEMESEVIIKACRAGYAIRFIPVQTVYSKGSIERSHIVHSADTVRWVAAVLRLWRSAGAVRASR